VDLYAGKASIVGRLEPVVAVLVRARVSPDALTLGAIPVALLGAVALLLSPSVPPLLLAVPILAAARLLLNLLDGAVARRIGSSHPRGELYNELADRVADLLFLAPVALLPGAAPAVVLAGVALAVLASYVGVVAKAAGGQRIYRGVLSKPGRMALLGAAAVAALLVGEVAWTAFGPLLLAGTGLTFAERVVIARRQLP
jgi:phosphatidylglycerophosphate synthase